MTAPETEFDEIEADTICVACFEPWGSIDHRLLYDSVEVDGVLKPRLTCTRLEAEAGA